MTAPEWVLEYDNGWADEPYAYDLKALCVAGSGYATLADRFGISWTAHVAPWSDAGVIAYDLTPGVGIDIVLSTNLDGVQPDFTQDTTTPIDELVAWGGGRPYTWRDPIWVVFHLEDVDATPDSWDGNASVGVWSDANASLAYFSQKRMSGAEKLNAVSRSMGVQEGVLIDSALGHDWYCGMQIAPYATGIRVDASGPPSEPADLGLPFTSEWFTKPVGFNSGDRQPTGPDWVPDYQLVMGAYTYGGGGGQVTAKVRRTQVWRWRVPGRAVVDSSGYERPLKLVAGAEIKTDRHKFGSRSLRLNLGLKQHLAVPNSLDWKFAGDFCVEGWCWIDAIINAPDGWQTLWAHGLTAADEQQGLWLTPEGALDYAVKVGGAWPIDLYSAPGSVTPRAWHHIMTRRRGTLWELGLDGVIVASVDDPTAIPVIADLVRIGAEIDIAYFTGNVDEFRISDVARHGTDPDTYPVPVEPFVSDGDTLLLLHFEAP